VPANRLADGADVEFGQPRVVLVGHAVVLGGRDHVEPAPGPVDMAGGLEARHPERTEEPPADLCFAIRAVHGIER